MERPRYVVEVKDEYGDLDYDYFHSRSDAINCAVRLNDSSARVVDRQEQAVVWTASATLRTSL